MRILRVIAAIIVVLLTGNAPVFAAGEVSLQEAKRLGAQRSKYRKPVPEKTAGGAPQANLKAFHAEIQPLLETACVQCHGPKKQKARFRIDTLDPDLVAGEDVNWWLEVVDVLSNGEMPPADSKAELPDEGRMKIIDWLSGEMQSASQARRAKSGHTSFRRLTRYEYNHALQDLLGLPLDFTGGLPPETSSEDGFKNSSEMLQISVTQFEQYRELARQALQKATVKGDRPREIYFRISLADIAGELAAKSRAPKKPESRSRKQAAAGPNSLRYLNRETGEAIAGHKNNLRGAPFAPTETPPVAPPVSTLGVAIPGGSEFAVNLGDQLPEWGNLRVRVRASRLSEGGSPPRLRLHYGFRASNNSHDTAVISRRDQAVDDTGFYEWTAALSEMNRNPFRGQKVAKVNPTEGILLENTNPKSPVFIDYIEVTAPAYDAWPPESHLRILPNSEVADENEYARRVVSRFMRRAWRRDIAPEEVERKLALYRVIRPDFEDRQDALIEVLANVLASPHFLYVIRSPKPDSFELAARLSFFLWSSIPDDALLSAAHDGRLDRPEELKRQVSRMLADPKARRFSRHFVSQWLGMELLDHLEVDKKIFRGFTPDLKEAMQLEPIAFFDEALSENRSIIDLLHADHAVINESLARFYGVTEPGLGGEFQRVALSGDRRGGLLTQAGLLSMNSDGKDSHPLKRGIWLLERILNDPPPPPPPSVPEIDLADPRIAKMTLKEQMEDHRNDPACMSCHARIDPWGIAFENFDAIGGWRDKIGNEPVDANATLFNQEKLQGIEGLKRYLLLHRQDQFARALTHKLAAYALGRPITFADRSEIEAITRRLRQQGDGLAELVSLIVTSDLFRNNLTQ